MLPLITLHHIYRSRLPDIAMPWPGANRDGPSTRLLPELRQFLRCSTLRKTASRQFQLFGDRELPVVQRCVEENHVNAVLGPGSIVGDYLGEGLAFLLLSFDSVVSVRDL